MENDELKILIEAALDLEKSIQNIVSDMGKLQTQLKKHQIKITAGLDKSASATQIKNDIAQLGKDKNRVELVGEIDENKTKKNIDNAIKSLSDAEIKITGVLDNAITSNNIRKSLEGIQDIAANVDVEANGSDEVENVRNQMDKAGTSAKNMASQLYIARSALQLLQQTANEAKDIIIDLDKAATDLALATGSGSEEAYKLLSDYNDMAQRLGATTTQVSDAAVEWLRQGKSAAETSALIEQSMILSKVGAMGADEATKNLTSTIKGFKLEVEDVAGVVDKLTAIDLEAAVTSADLATAVARTASSANLAGVDMDRLLGYITTVEETTQKSAETVGESFKTIFARMGNVKLGKLLDDDGEDLSDTEKILNNFGIALRENNDVFRDFDAVLDDIAARWSDFSNVEQSAIATTIAGTRQRENFLVLMENYGKALEYTGVAADSAGTSMEKFAAYEDSIEAKSASFVAAVESLTMDTVDSDLAKDLIDASTALLGFAEKAGLLRAVLLSLGAGATIKGIQSIATGFKNISQNVLNMGEASNVLKRLGDVSALSGEQIGKLGTLIKGLSDDQLKLILSSKNLSTAQMQAILMASGLSAEEAAQKVQTLGLAASQQTAVGATWSLSAAMNGLKVALLANPIGAIMTAISAATVVLSLFTNAWEEEKQKQEEARQKMMEVADAAQNEAKAISDLYDTYTAANKAYQDNTGSKDDLTAATDSLLEALGYEKSEISDLIDEYGSLGNAIDEATKKSLEQKAASILEGYDAAKEDALNDAAESIGRLSGDAITVKTSGEDKKFAELLQTYGYLKDEVLPLLSTSLYTGINDYGNFDSLLAGYEKLIEIKEKLESGIGTNYTAEELAQADVYTDIAAKINAVSEAIEKVNGYTQDYNKIQAQLSYMDFVKNNGIPETKEQYDALRQSLLDTADASGKYLGSQNDIESAITNTLSSIPDLEQFVNFPVEAYSAEIQALQDQNQELKKSLADDPDLQITDTKNLQSEIDKLKDRNALLEEALGAIEYYNEVSSEVVNRKIDPNQTIFGNIDLDNRQIIEWTEQTTAAYEDALASWGASAEEMLGSISTVFGGYELFDNNIPIAFSPILQTENGAVLLSRDTIMQYIQGLIDAAGEGWDSEDLFKLDTTGMEVDGVVIKNLIADIGTTAKDTAENMHYIGKDGAIKSAAKGMANAAKSLGMSAGELAGKYDSLNEEFEKNERGIAKIEGVSAAIDENNEKIKEHQDYLSQSGDEYRNTTGEIEDNTNALNANADALENAEDAVDLSTVSGDLISKLSEYQSEFKNLSEVINEFTEKGSVSISTLDSLSEKFGDLSSFSDFAEVMLDSASSAEEAQEAWSQLAGEYLDSTGILNNVTAANVGVVESFLSQIGVVNAHSVAMSSLSAVELEAVVAANGLTGANWEQVDSFLEEQGVADSTRQKLQEYRIEQLKAAYSATNLATASASTVSALLNQADAAGVAASSLAALSAAMAALSYNHDTYNPEKSVVGSGGIRAYEKIAAQNYQKQKAEEEKYKPIFNIPTGGGSGGGGGGSSGKEDDPTKELKEQLDKLVSDFEHQIFILEKRGTSTATSVVDNATQTAGQIVDIYREMQVAVNQQANKYRSMGLAENSEEIQELQRQWWEYKENIQETMTSCYEYIRKQRENAIMLNEDWLENAVSDKNYTDITRYSSAIIENYKTMQNELHEQAEYYRSLGYSDTSDEVSKLSDLWHDYANKIRDVRDKVIDYINDIVDAAHDSVDEIQNVSDVLHKAADEFAANDGFITLDTYQELSKVGAQYLQLLEDENGLWEINEERINDVIAARTRQLAVENAMAYVEKLKLAAQEGSAEELNNLIFATTSATNSTWGLVYAELELMHVMGDLNDSQYQAALHNVQAMEDLAENVIQNIGKETDVVAKRLEGTRKQLEETKDALQDTLDELEDMQDGANDLVDYVMDMLKHRIQEQIDLLEEMKDKYSEIIDLKKESLDAAKEEQDYDRNIAKKLKEMAKLQERLNALSLDDSRSSKAEQAKLLEELAELQEDLSDTQADKAIENQKEALDAMEKDYHAEKDKEIEILENSISSTQKLYDMAIAYIRDNWNTLYQELIEWNTEYGSVLNSEITEAWEAAQAAAQRYGDFVSAIMGGISDEIESITQQIKDIDLEIESLNTSSSSSSSEGNKNTTVGNKGQHTSPSSAEMVRTIVGRMKEYASQWGATTDKNKQKDLQSAAANLAKQLGQYGVNASFDSSRGVWTITRDDINPSNVGKLLYNCYHTGGFVGDEPLKPNERYIKAEDGELMMTSSQQDSLATQLDRIRAMADVFANGVVSSSTSAIGSGLSQIERGTINNITNNSRPIQINIGDTIIQGNASAETVAAHERVTEKMVNDFARFVGLKW